MEIPLLRQPFPWPLLPAPNRNFKQLCHQLIVKANCSSFLLSFVLYYVSFTKLELLKARRVWGEKEEREEKKKRKEGDREQENMTHYPLELLNYSFYRVKMKCGPSCTKPLTLNTQTQHKPMKAAMSRYPIIVICLLHDSWLCYNY